MQSKSHNKLYALMAWMGVVPLMSSATIALLAISYEAQIYNFSVWAWGLFYIATTITMALAITPTTFISLFSGFFLGFEGILPLVISYQLASLMGYNLAKKFDDSFLDLILTKYPTSRQMFDNVKQNQFILVLLSRLSPALPFAIMNVVLSISRIRISNFFWGGLIGMLPRTLFFIWVGQKASELNEALEGTQNFYISAVLSIFIVYIIYRIVKKQLK
ncbi:MAG: VTT domain-containing protein [Cyclobacteriaceae bacterium]|nr:VTT domain-containing protein [Cyclobacteriaceae bacterium]